MKIEHLTEGMKVFCGYYKTEGAIAVRNGEYYICSNLRQLNGKNCGREKYGYQFSYFIGTTTNRSQYSYIIETLYELNREWDRESNS